MKKRLLACVLSLGMLLSACSTGKTEESQETMIPLSPKLIEGEYVWIFDINYTNETDEPLRLLSLEMYDKQGDGESEEIYTIDELVREGFAENSELLPGETFSLYLTTRMMPIAEERTFVLTGRNDAFEPFCQVYAYDLLETEKYVPTKTQRPVPEPENPVVSTPSESEFPVVDVYPQGQDWQFVTQFLNETGSPLTFKQLEIVNYLGGEKLDIFTLTPDNFPFEVPNPAPGEDFFFEDWHPVADMFDARDYIFLFADGSGSDYVRGVHFVVHKEGAPTGNLSTEDPNFVPWLEDAQTLYLQETGDWRFTSAFQNDTGSVLTLQHVNIVDVMNGADIEPFILTPDQLQGIQTTLQPGEQFIFVDGHPQVDHFNGRRYIFTFRDASGKEVIRECRFNLYNGLDPAIAPVDYSVDEGKDLKTLRHTANFAVNVAPGVDWVPAAVLGETNRSNREIYQMRDASPEDKRDMIGTLYEALQLYQISDFRAADDNVRIPENGINWEHHKPGYYAVLTNEGCCATDSNWLNYILKNDYEEVGFMATSQRDGSGHIFNYIKHDGSYYFIDLTHYRAADSFTAVESGDPGDYYATDYILGNIHRADSPEAYAQYMVNAFGDPPGLIFLYTAEDCLAVDGVWENGGITITYGVPDGVDVKVIYDDPSDGLTHAFVAPPAKRFEWDSLPHYNFS